MPTAKGWSVHDSDRGPATADGQWVDFRDRYQSTLREVETVLGQLDQLAELWGDEGVFRRCRDRLRALLPRGEG